MAEGNTVSLGENTPEHVAYTLMCYIMALDSETAKTTGKLTREYVLQLFAECMLAVSRPELKANGELDLKALSADELTTLHRLIRKAKFA